MILATPSNPAPQQYVPLRTSFRRRVPLFNIKFKDHISKFQGPYLLLLTHVTNKLWLYFNINGFCSLGQPILWKFVNRYLTFTFSMPILFCWLQNSICQRFLEVGKCSTIQNFKIFKDHNEWKGISRTFKALKRDSCGTRANPHINSLKWSHLGSWFNNRNLFMLSFSSIMKIYKTVLLRPWTAV